MTSLLTDRNSGDSSLDDSFPDDSFLDAVLTDEPVRRRVIAVHPHADLYGSDRMFLESVAALGPDVLTVLSTQGPLLDALTERGLDVRVLDFPVLRKVELSSPLAALRFLGRFGASVVRLARWLRAEDAGIVYVSTIAAPEWLLAARLSGAHVVCHLHENMPMRRPLGTVLLAPLLAAHRVIANSADTRDWVASSLGRWGARRTCVVHNGVREPAPDQAAAPAPRPDGPRRLTLVGRLSAIKGQDTAIRATALVRRAGVDVELTLVGDVYPGYESLEQGLRELAAAEGVADATIFTGFTDPVPHVQAADVVLMPSRMESFGLAAVEALLLGRPVVATRVGGLPEVISDGETGLLVDPDDPQALADAVLALLRDPELAARLAAAGRNDARARFSMTAFAEALTAAVEPAS